MLRRLFSIAAGYFWHGTYAILTCSGTQATHGLGSYFMIRSIKTFAWLRDLVIVLLFIAGFNLWHSSPRLGILLVGAAAVVFVERVLWSWYLLDLRDQQNGSSTS